MESAEDTEADAESGAELTVIDGVGDAKAEALVEAGFETVADIQDASEDDLAEAEGVGDAFAERIKEGASEVDPADVEGGN
nr:helix-hairpin-helix domain-containing protein [Halococcus qingdaonensis]